MHRCDPNKYLPSKEELGIMAMKEYFTFPKNTCGSPPDIA